MELTSKIDSWEKFFTFLYENVWQAYENPHPYNDPCNYVSYSFQHYHMPLNWIHFDKRLWGTWGRAIARKHGNNSEQLKVFIALTSFVCGQRNFCGQRNWQLNIPLTVREALFNALPKVLTVKGAVKLGAAIGPHFWKLREAMRGGLIYNGSDQKQVFYCNVLQGKIWSELGVDDEDRYLIRVSAKDPKMIVITPDNKYGAADRQVRSSLGKVLSRLQPKYGWNENQIRDAVTMWNAEFDGGELKIARTREEIARVYRDGPESCMSGGKANYRGISTKDGVIDIHAAEVYASADCGVAYLERGKNITARTVMNMKDKKYTRLYGDEYRLLNALEKAGYSEGTLNGCELLRISRNDGRFVVPYLDRGDGFAVFKDKLMVSDDYNLDSDCGPGWIDSDNMRSVDDNDDEYCTCAECGGRIHDDSACSLYDSEDYVCDICVSNLYVTAVTSYRNHRDYTLEYVRENSSDLVNLAREFTAAGVRYAVEAVLRSGNAPYSYSEFEQEWLHEDDVVYCQHMEDYIKGRDAVQLRNDDYAHEADVVELPDGKFDLEENCDLLNPGAEKDDRLWALDDAIIYLPDGQSGMKAYVRSDHDTAEHYDSDYLVGQHMETDKWYPVAQLQELFNGSFVLISEAVQDEDGDWVRAPKVEEEWALAEQLKALHV